MVVGAERKEVHKARPFKAKTRFGEKGRVPAREVVVGLRKDKSTQAAMKKRNVGAAFHNDSVSPATESSLLLELGRIARTFSQQETNPFALSDEALYEATKRLRLMIGSEEDNPGITQTAINAGMVPVLVKLLYRDKDPQTVFEAVYSLVNITYVTSHVVFHQSGAVQQLAKLVATSDTPEIREHAAWCFGNMACESSQFRDAILEVPHALQGLIRNLKEPANEAMLKTVSWVCRCIVRRSPRLPQHFVESFVPAFVDVLQKCEASKVDVSMRVNTVVCLAEVMGWGDNLFRYCLHCGVLEPLIELIRNHVDSPTTLYAVRALGNVPPEQPALTNRLVNQGFLQCAPSLLGHEKPGVQESTSLILCRIVAGSKNQAQQVFRAGHEHELTRRLIRVALDAHYRTRVNSTWAVCRLVLSLPNEEMHEFESLGVIDVLVDALRMKCEIDLISMSLQALYKVLGIRRVTAVVKVEELYGEDILVELVDHDDDDIHNHAQDVLNEFFHYESLQSEIHDGSFSVLLECDESSTFSLPSKELFPADCSSGDSPWTPIRRFDGSTLSPNVLDMSIGETAQI